LGFRVLHTAFPAGPRTRPGKGLSRVAKIRGAWCTGDAAGYRRPRLGRAFGVNFRKKAGWELAGHPAAVFLDQKHRKGAFAGETKPPPVFKQVFALLLRRFSSPNTEIKNPHFALPTSGKRGGNGTGVRSELNLGILNALWASAGFSLGRACPRETATGGEGGDGFENGVLRIPLRGAMRVRS